MRKLIYAMNSSLDGYVAGPNGDLDWVIADEELHEYSAQLLKTADIVLFGRVTYQLLESYWPTVNENSTMTRGEIEYAQTINSLRKIVYSKTLSNVGWNTEIVKEISPEEINRMKQQPGKDIALAGGANTASIFLQNGLIDEMIILVHPAVLGGGKPLFSGTRKNIRLDLSGTHTLGSGVVALQYRIVDKSSGGLLAGS